MQANQSQAAVEESCQCGQEGWQCGPLQGGRHCTLQNQHCRLHTTHCPLHTAYFTQHTPHCTGKPDQLMLSVENSTDRVYQLPGSLQPSPWLLDTHYQFLEKRWMVTPHCSLSSVQVRRLEGWSDQE